MHSGLNDKLSAAAGRSGWGRSAVGGRGRVLYELGHDVIMSSLVVYPRFAVALIRVQRAA